MASYKMTSHVGSFNRAPPNLSRLRLLNCSKSYCGSVAFVTTPSAPLAALYAGPSSSIHRDPPTHKSCLPSYPQLLVTLLSTTSRDPLILRKQHKSFISTMPPTLLLIRHAQALHNATSDWSIHDPPLSKLGEEQCKELQESLKNSQIANQVELIVISPMRRTLQTASIGLEWLIKDKGIKVLTDAGWQGMFRRIHSLGSSSRTFFLPSTVSY